MTAMKKLLRILEICLRSVLGIPNELGDWATRTKMGQNSRIRWRRDGLGSWEACTTLGPIPRQGGRRDGR